MGQRGQPSCRITGHMGSHSWAAGTPRSLDLAPALGENLWGTCAAMQYAGTRE